jgi:hypothetical protein
MIDEMDNQQFMAIAEGLAALSMLEKLQLPGFCVHVPLYLHEIRPDSELDETLKQAIEEMKKYHWPLLEKIEWS